MATIANRPNTALLVIDMQNGVVQNVIARNAVISNINFVVGQARLERVPVIWIQDFDEQRQKGSHDWQIVNELMPEKSEPLIDKTYSDAFEDTTLEAVLADLGVGRLVVVGAQTDACIRSTLHGAFARGYDVKLVSDAPRSSSAAHAIM